MRPYTIPRSRFYSLRWPRALAVLFCSALAVGLPAAYAFVHGIPKPVVQDEFSYLLGADTFARGRLTNPSPELSEFFEAPHVLVSPSYSSKYPPGQALVLAFGQVFFGHPIWGVWISAGLFAGSLCWMLQAWVPRHWALHFSVVAALTLGTAGYWAQSYWGGMLQAAGASLLFGGMRRTLHRPRISTSALLALGVVILANCRPYEGLLTTVPAGLMLTRWLVRSRRTSLRDKITRFVAPAAAVLAMGAGWTMTHNQAVTGKALQLPYALHHRQYWHQGFFVFSSMRPAERPVHPRVDLLTRNFTYPELHGLSAVREIGLNVLTGLPRTLSSAFGAPPSAGRRFLGVAVWIPVLLLAQTWSPRRLLFGVAAALTLEIALWRAGIAYPTLIGAVVVAAFVATLLATRKRLRSMTFIAATVGIVVFGNALVWWWLPHYLAPVFPLIIAAAAMAVHRMARLSVAYRPGRLAVNTFLLVLAQLVAMAAASGLTPEFARPDTQPTYVDIRRNLLEQGGRHLVFVRYGEDYPNFRGDWVYNEAEIHSAPVVFAHDFGLVRNQALIAAYPGRKQWLLEVSKEAVLLHPCCR